MSLPLPLRSRLLAVALLVLATGGAAAADPAVPVPATLPGGPRPFVAEWNGRPLLHGVSFSPFRRGQSPNGALPNDAELLADLRLVARHWHLLRMYESADVTQRTLRLIDEHRLPLRVVVGVWIAREDSDTARAANARQVADAIALANRHPAAVIAVSVGNETQVEWSGHRSPAADLIRHLRTVRAAIRQPVTTADDFNFWNKPAAQAVAAEVDFIMLHFYALWNGRPLESALEWSDQVYADIARLHPGKPIVVGETGWATEHDATRRQPWEEGSLMKAEVSPAAQVRYLEQHFAWVQRRQVVTFLFEAFDESWKGGGAETSPAAAEKHWGVYDEERRPKPGLAVIERYLRP